MLKKELVTCPRCGSLSHIIDMTNTGAIYYPPFTDKWGRIHIHDFNKYTTHYVCRDCGNKFTNSKRMKCWCGQ